MKKIKSNADKAVTPIAYQDCESCKHRSDSLADSPCDECSGNAFDSGNFDKWEPDEHPATNLTPDPVNHPNHYTFGGIECIDAVKAAVTGLTGIEAVCTGQIIKYIWRWKHKNGLEDLKKCRWYLDRLVKEVDHD